MNPLNYHVYENVTGLSQAGPKLKHHQTQENAANDSLATQGTNYKAVKEFSKQPNACVVAKSGHLYYSK